MKTILFASLLMLSACATPSLFDVNHHDAPVIDYAAGQPEPPRVSQAQLDKSEIEKCEAGDSSCELIVYNSAKEAPAVKKNCLATGGKKAECEKAYGEMLVSRWIMKYDLADFKAVELWCKTQPVECNLRTMRGQAAMEMKLRESNQYKAAEMSAEQAERAHAQVVAIEAENRRRIGAALSAFQPKSRCNSARQYDGSVQTTCY